MSDLIRREDAIRVASGYCHWTNIPKELEKLPSAQPERLNVHESQKDADCISRQAAIDAMAELQGRASSKGELTGISKAWKKIKKLPSVQPERKPGRWILIKGSNGKDYHKCSNCLHEQDITGVKNYCAVCGSKMEEKMKKTQSNWLSRVEVIQAMIALFRDNTEVTLDDVLDAINAMEDDILWTTVDDYLPEVGDLVLVSMGDEVGLGMYVGPVSYTEWWDDCQNEVEVDAWAELPMSLKEVEDGR